VNLTDMERRLAEAPTEIAELQFTVARFEVISAERLGRLHT